MDDPAWDASPWSEPFVDIEGDHRPAPRHETRVRMAWDDACLYVGARLEDPHVFAAITQKNAVVFHDPDFEIFIDPDGDNHHYYEFEVNALGTIWELYLERPYRAGGPVHEGHNLDGLIHAVHVDGTLNDPTDVDRGWSVEVGIPWRALAPFARATACPPQPGDVWRVNFSRVQWLFDVVDGGYVRRPRETHPEDNWVWSPQHVIDMHRPETWGYVTFADDASRVALPDPTWPARDRLMALYDLQREREVPLLDATRLPAWMICSEAPLVLAPGEGGWSAYVDVPLETGTARVAVDAEGRLTTSDGLDDGSVL